MRIQLSNVLLLFFLGVFSSTSQITNIDVRPKIESNLVGDIITITATANSNTELIQNLRYVMYVIKKNPSNENSSRNEQSGRFVLTANESKELATTSINQTSKDKVTILLLIYDNEDKLLGKDRKVVLNNDEKETIEKTKIQRLPKEDDYAGFRGIVTEQTKTKPGRDFYKLFYSDYLLKGINGEKIVAITEKIGFGRNTILEIKVDHTLVYRFNVNPRADVLRDHATNAIRQVTRYFQNLKKQRALINQN